MDGHTHDHDHSHSHGHDHGHENGIRKMTTKEFLTKVILDRRKYKNKVELTSNAIPPSPPRSKINHLAVILDNEVQEIMRAENRLAALLLSGPTFVEFDPDEVRPEIGWTYVDEKFSDGE